MGTTAGESLNAAANIFIGQVYIMLLVFLVNFMSIINDKWVDGSTTSY